MFYQNVLTNINTNSFFDSVVIDGCSGCGKTTLMSLLKEMDNDFKLYPEPVEDNPLLDKYFYDRNKYSFPLQIFFLNRKFEDIQTLMHVKKSLLDRSIYTNVVFAKTFNEINELTNEEFNVYLEVYKNMMRYCYPPKLFIYLESSTEGIIKRIHKRGREYEKEANYDYWDTLNKNYINFFKEYQLSPVIKINVDDYNFADNIEHKNIVKEMIISKLNNINSKLILTT